MTSAQLHAKKILLKVSQIGLTLQGADGGMPAGHNGSRFQNETPIRNTAHWIILFLTAYRLSGEKKYFTSAKKCLSFLLAEKWRSPEGIFYLRDHPGKNKSNGLIGQVWVLEALLFCHKYFDDEREKILQIAEKTFESIPFSHGLGLWRIKDFDGKIHGVARTFNQQLWLSYIGLQLSATTGHARHSKKSQILLQAIGESKHLSLHLSGLIDHMIMPTYKVYGPSGFLYLLGRKIFEIYRARKGLLQILSPAYKMYDELCLGYQSFNLSGFATIHQEYPQILSPQLIEKIHKAITFCEIDSYYQKFPNNGYGYSYNPIGWEMAHVELVFKQNEQLSLYWLKTQEEQYFSPEMMPKNTQDPATLLARVYELHRLFPD